MENPLSLRRIGAPAVTALLTSTLALGAAPAVAAPIDTAPLVQGSIDELAVSVVGDGVQTGNAAVPVTIEQILSDGTTVDSLTLPTSATEDTFAFTLGADREQAGALQRSTNGEYLTIGGYDAEPGWTDVEGQTALNGSSSSEVTRVVASIDASGTVDVSTGLGGAYDFRHIRGAVTEDNQSYWTGGHGNDTENDHRGGVLYAEANTNDPTPVTFNGGQLNNTRVPVINDGQLYVSSDRSDYNGVNQVGEGLPTESADLTLIAAAPEGRATAHDFAFIGDSLYVTYTEDNPALVRYDLDESDSSWTATAAFPGEFWGVTGREAGDDVLLYTVEGAQQGNEIVALLDEGLEGEVAAPRYTVSRADGGYAYRGIAFAAGFVPETTPVDFDQPEVTFVWDTRLAGGSGNALSAVLGESTNPTATGSLVRNTENVTARVERFRIESSQESVARPEDVRLDYQAPTGEFEVTVSAQDVGQTVLRIIAEFSDGTETSTRLDYWVSAPLNDATAFAHVGMSDASAAQAVGDGYFLVGDDDSNYIRLYGESFDEPVAEFNVAETVVPIENGRSWDIESSARIDNVIYWIGSMGNSRSGNLRPDRDIIVATAVTGTGADTQLETIGYTHGVRQALVDWDNNNGHGEGAQALGFERATQDGWSAEGPQSLNVEGAAIAPDGTSLWLGFRSPLTPLEDGQDALIVSIENIHKTVVDGEDITINDHINLDLDGRAIRSIANTDDGQYLIQGGSADDAGNFALFGWTGESNDSPVQSINPMGLEGWPGSYEALLHVEDLQDGTTVRVIQDDGTVDIYNNGTEAQDLSREFMKFVSQEYTLDFQGAFAEDAPGEDDNQGETPDTPNPDESTPQPPAPETPETETPQDDDDAPVVTSPADPSPGAQPDGTDPEAGDDSRDPAAGEDLAVTGPGYIALILAFSLSLVALGYGIHFHRRRTINEKL